MLYAFSSGTYDTRIVAVDLADGNHAIWGKYFDMTANVNELKVINGTLHVAGSFSEIYQTVYNSSTPNVFERNIRGALKLNASNGLLLNWFPQPAFWNGGGYARQ